MGYEWMKKTSEFTEEAQEILPILSAHEQLFFRVEGISRMTPLWDLDIAKALLRLENRGWVIFGKRISHPKELKGLEDDLYVALKERIDRMQSVKDRSDNKLASAGLKQALLPIY
tara:strand:- start:2926 stop:3270 length:345 start_codon:yes stop_codon:yes gene_type:complete